jgi:hypothetical protein
MSPKTVILCVAVAAALPSQQTKNGIDTGRSTIAIHVGKSGLLSVAAHDHTIAPLPSRPAPSSSLRLPILSSLSISRT